MKCVDCGFRIHECICKDCQAGDYTIVPSSIGNRLYFDLESKGGGFVSTFSKNVDSMESSDIKQGIREAKIFFRNRGHKV